MEQIEPLALPQYEIFAVRYANMARRRSDNFIQRDLHDGPMPLDFFVWLLKSRDNAVLIDTGFNHAMAEQRGRDWLRCPIDALRALGVNADDIEHVVLTHLHYDHAGNLDKLPRAQFHLQEAELGYAAGPCMLHDMLRHAYAVEDVVQVVRALYAKRLAFSTGDAELLPGIELKLIGGHTKGLQAVRVHTQRGWVMLASDASHYYENLEREQPFPIVYSVADMLAGYDIVRRGAASPAHIIPGHDPQVLTRYPAWSPETPDIVCLHMDPKQEEAWKRNK